MDALSALWTFPAIVLAAILIAWSAECGQFFISQGLALAVLAWVQTLRQLEFEPRAVLAQFEPATGLKDVEKLDDSAVVVLFNELCDRYRVSVVALDTYTGVAFGPGKTHRELPIERKRAILADPEPFLKVVARKNGKPVDEPPVNWSAKAPEAFRMNPDPTADGVVDGIPY